MSSTAEKIIAPKLLWYLSHHPNQDKGGGPNPGRLRGKCDTAPAISHVKVIKKLLDKDSRQA